MQKDKGKDKERNKDTRRYVIIIGDGMADYPIPELDHKTPLEIAHTPNMDILASCGRIGVFASIPDGMEPGSDVANMSILGYDPHLYYTGRAPIEAASMGVNLMEDEMAFRMNLVTLSFDKGKILMKSHSSGEITTQEARELIAFLEENMPLPEGTRIYPGVAYRHLLVWKNGPMVKTLPPHDFLDMDMTGYLSNDDPVVSLIRLSWKYLRDHPVNMKRREKGLYEANSIWLWGQGRSLRLPSFKDKLGLSGGIISAVDLIKGLGILAGLSPIRVEGATGYLDTNYKGKADAAIEFLKDHDFVFIHVEAPDEAGHNGDIEGKIYAIERIDRDVVGRVMQGMAQFEDYAILIASDHFTPIIKRTHTREPAPFAWATKSKITGNPVRIKFCEREARASRLSLKGHELISAFLKYS